MRPHWETLLSGLEDGTVWGKDVQCTWGPSTVEILLGYQCCNGQINAENNIGAMNIDYDVIIVDSL